LRGDAGEPDRAADGDRHAAFVEHLAVEIHLSLLIGVIATGQAAENGQRGVSFVPAPEPGFAVEMKGIGKHQPAVGVGWCDAGFEVPVTGAVGLLDLFLGEMNGLEFRARKIVKREDQTGPLLKFQVVHDEACAGTTREERHLAMHPENFQYLPRVGEEPWRHEHKPERDPRRGQAGTELRGPCAESGLVEIALPVGGDGMFALHEGKLARAPPIANLN
jgi:hypothetical protein